MFMALACAFARPCDVRMWWDAKKWVTCRIVDRRLIHWAIASPLVSIPASMFFERKRRYRGSNPESSVTNA